MAEFAACSKCHRIFQIQDGATTLCTRCRGTSDAELGTRDALRLIKSTLRDSEAKGILMTLAEVAAATGIDEERVWGFIVSGELDTASFSDPQVRDYVLKRRRELLRQSQSTHKDETPEESRPRGGFHTRTDDDARR